MNLRFLKNGNYVQFVSIKKLLCLKLCCHIEYAGYIENIKPFYKRLVTTAKTVYTGLSCVMVFISFFSFFKKIHFSSHQKYLLPELHLWRDISRTIKGFMVSNYIMRKLVSIVVMKISFFY